MFRVAEQRVESLEEEAEEQAKRRFWARRTGRARSLLASAEVEVASLKESTASAVLSARESAEVALEEAKVATDQVSAAYWRAPRGKDTRADILRMRADLEKIQSELAEVIVLLEQGDFIKAHFEAEGLALRATTLSHTIDRSTAHRLALVGSKITS